jgi:uncharacterized protein
MAGLPKAMVWRRLDAAGAEQVLFSDRSGLHARGTMVSAVPVPFVARYDLYTDDAWVSARLEVSVEGAGFVRQARLERAAGRWRVTATEQGDLDTALTSEGHPRAGLPGSDDPGQLEAVLDIDIGYSPLTNILPVRRLGLLTAPIGTEHTVTVAWVLLPSLEVVASEQTYTVLGGGQLRFTSGTFRADLSIDDQGYVTHYPGLAERG